MYTKKKKDILYEKRERPTSLVHNMPPLHIIKLLNYVDDGGIGEGDGAADDLHIGHQFLRRSHCCMQVT